MFHSLWFYKESTYGLVTILTSDDLDSNSVSLFWTTDANVWSTKRHVRANFSKVNLLGQSIFHFKTRKTTSKLEMASKYSIVLPHFLKHPSWSLREWSLILSTILRLNTIVLRETSCQCHTEVVFISPIVTYPNSLYFCSIYICINYSQVTERVHRILSDILIII